MNLRLLACVSTLYFVLACVSPEARDFSLEGRRVATIEILGAE